MNTITDNTEGVTVEMNHLCTLLLTIILIGFSVSTTHAVDHSNLDEGRPSRVEDPYPIAHGELALEAGFGFNIERRGDDRFFSPIEILY